MARLGICGRVHWEVWLTDVYGRTQDAPVSIGYFQQPSSSQSSYDGSGMFFSPLLHMHDERGVWAKIL